jgi:ankyrin repeat protein/beta-lactamase regulating signal transducer with metallopeptidase domain
MSDIINNCLMGLNNAGRLFCDYAAGAFIQSALLVIVLFVVDLLLRKRVRAVFRYCLWLLVLVKLILPPTLCLPTGIGYWTGDHLPATSGFSSGIFDAAMLEPASPAAEMPQVLSGDIAGQDALTSSVSVLIPVTWQAVLFVLWLVGVIVFAALLIQRVRFVKRLVAAGTCAEQGLLDVLDRCSRQLGVRRRVTLKISDSISGPAVCGLFRPTVLIPAALVEKLSPEGLRATLIHELAHVKRGDLWVNAVQTCLQAVYFYNPFVWFANSVIRRVCEEAVDETVLVALGGQAKHYSNILIDIGEMAFWKVDLGLRLIGVAESKKALQWRIRHMLTRPIPTSSRVGAFGIAALVAIAAILLPMAKAQKLGEENEAVAAKPDERPSKSLHQAAADGDVEQVKLLIARGADVNAKDGEGNTALHTAAEHCHIEVAELLLESGADIEAEGAVGRTPLHCVAGSGFSGTLRKEQICEMAEFLIAEGADVNAAYRTGASWTPLHYAARDGYKDLVELLVAKGADINAQDGFGRTPIDLAITLGYRGEASRAVAVFLVRKGADVSPMHWAAFTGDLEQLKELLGRGMGANAKEDRMGATPLFFAAAGGQKDAVDLLLAEGAEVNAKAGRGAPPLLPLQLAIKSGEIDVVELLIDKGADVNSGGMVPPLHMAALLGRTDMTELLIASGADVNASPGFGPFPFTPLQMALVEVMFRSESGLPFGLSGGLSVGPDLKQRRDLVELLLSAGAGLRGLPPDTLHVLARLDAWEIAEPLISHDLNVNTKHKGVTALHTAAEHGSKAMAKVLAAKGADVNARNSEGETPLSIAREKGHTEIAKLLRAHGAKDNSSSSAGEDDAKPAKSLHQAAADGDVEQVKSLIARGADVGRRDKRGRAPLDLAAQNGHASVAGLLITNGAGVNVKNRWGWTPLHHAAQEGHKDVVELLIGKGAEVNAKNNWGSTPLHCTADKEVAKLLIAKGADVNAKDDDSATPIGVAITSPPTAGHKALVTLLVSEGAEVAPIHLAAYFGDVEKVERFLNQGVNVNAEGPYTGTALHIAAGAGQTDVVELLLAKGADVNATVQGGATALHCVALSKAKADVAKLLLENGADVNAAWRNEEGLPGRAIGGTPLHLAAIFNELDLARVLIAHGADVNSKSWRLAPSMEGFTPLTALILGNRFDESQAESVDKEQGVSIDWKQRTPLAELLISSGADINAWTGYRGGKTFLHLLATVGVTEMAETFIAHGADVNVKDLRGQTPLHDAAKAGSFEMVKLLIAKGADVNVKDNQGNTPVSQAKRKAHTEIAELLRQHGAKE